MNIINENIKQKKFKYHFCNSNQNPVDHELYKDYKSRLDHEL